MNRSSPVSFSIRAEGYKRLEASIPVESLEEDEADGTEYVLMMTPADGAS